MNIYLPFEKTNLKMGLRSLDLQNWLDLDENLPIYLRTKDQLLQHRHPDVVISSSESQAPQQELLDLVLNFLQSYHANQYEITPDQITCKPLHQSWDPKLFRCSALELAARLIQEDLCLLQLGSEGYVLSAGSVCFPSHWSLRAKVGSPLEQIHQPVPGYNSRLQHPVDSYFSKLTVEYPSYRFNWSLVNTPELFLGDLDQPQVELLAEDFAKDCDIETAYWIRVERQTLRRLPQTQAIVFTIRTYVYPLSILRDYPQAAQALKTAIDIMPIPTQQYKRIHRIRPQLLDYLGSLAAPSP